MLKERDDGDKKPRGDIIKPRINNHNKLKLNSFLSRQKYSRTSSVPEENTKKNEKEKYLRISPVKKRKEYLYSFMNKYEEQKGSRQKKRRGNFEDFSSKFKIDDQSKKNKDYLKNHELNRIIGI